MTRPETYIHDRQQEIITALCVKPVVDVDAEIQKRVDFLKEYVLRVKAKGLLIAVSGGIDSGVAAALCKKATDELTAETGNSYTTLGVFQPYHEQEDIEDSYAVAKAIGLDTVETNIANPVEATAAVAEAALGRQMDKKTLGNIKARTRMVVQYALSFERGLIVVGTDHASEALTGFFTKWGDGAVDITPLSTLNKRQVRALGRRLGIPNRVVTKAPTAGLWAGQTDEEELGVSYEHNSDFLEGKTVPAESAEILIRYYDSTYHKRATIPGV